MIGTQYAGYLTHDGGKSWERRGHGIPFGEVDTIRFSNSNPALVAAGDYREGGVFLSTDGGENFYRVDQQLPSSRISTIVFDDADSERLFVGSFSGGIYL